MNEIEIFTHFEINISNAFHFIFFYVNVRIYIKKNLFKAFIYILEAFILLILLLFSSMNT